MISSMKLLVGVLSLVVNIGAEPQVKGLCGEPGIPEMSTLSQQQNTYTEDQTVFYTCNEFISIIQSRMCVRGKWRGESAVCGKSYGDNDVKWAKIYDKLNGTLIQEYNTSVLKPFPKFANSFVAERYARPLRAFGSKSYRIELSLQYKAIFHLVRISLSVVNLLIDDSIKSSKFNITKVTAGPYRVCRHIRYVSVSPWLHNSTRYDYWYNCESIDGESYEKELEDKTDLITIETESNAILNLDLATFILTRQYLNGGNPHEPICGLPEVPIGRERLVINHNTKYAINCAPGFKDIDAVDGRPTTHSMACATDMKWTGSVPNCVPEKTCDKFELSERHTTKVFQYERVYFYNETVWMAIEGTKAHFRCKDDTQIFIGKEVRVCGKDGQWSDSTPNCLDSGSKLNLTSISIIIMVTLILTFGLSALLVYCVLRMKRIRSEKLGPNGGTQSNFYDDYDFRGLDAKTVDETYETVDEERYADDRQVQRPMGSAYTTMMGNELYPHNYHDKNVYDDCQQNQSGDANGSIDLDDSYVVMKVK